MRRIVIAPMLALLMSCASSHVVAPPPTADETAPITGKPTPRPESPWLHVCITAEDGWEASLNRGDVTAGKLQNKSVPAAEIVFKAVRTPNGAHAKALLESWVADVRRQGSGSPSTAESEQGDMAISIVLDPSGIPVFGEPMMHLFALRITDALANVAFLAHGVWPLSHQEAFSRDEMQLVMSLRPGSCDAQPTMNPNFPSMTTENKQ